MKKAFTLVELIVVITILAIIGTISFISLSGYSKEARDSKRIADTRNIINKISIENTRGITLNELINQTDKKTNTLTINGNKVDGYQGYPNFDKLIESEENFRDPKNGNKYPFAYSVGGTGTLSYKFMQMATVSEIDGRARLVGNYYKMNETLDSPSLFTTEGKDGTDLDNDYIIDNGDKPPYEIGVPVSPLVCTTGSHEVNGICKPIICETGNYLDGNDCKPIVCEIGKYLDGNDCKDIICETGKYLDGNDCKDQWSGNLTDGFVFKNASGSTLYPTSCNNLLTDTQFQVGNSGPYNGTKFMDGIYYIIPTTDTVVIKVYCDMTTDGGGWTKVMHANWANFFTTSNWNSLNTTTPNNTTLYSILDKIDLFRDGTKYTFRYQVGDVSNTNSYTSRKNWNIWSQTHNPFTSTTNGSDYIFISGQAPTTCGGFNGLHNKYQGRSMATDVDSLDSINCWRMQVVPTLNYGGQGYLNGYGGVGHYSNWQILWIK